MAPHAGDTRATARWRDGACEAGFGCAAVAAPLTRRGAAAARGRGARAVRFPGLRGGRGAQPLPGRQGGHTRQPRGGHAAVAQGAPGSLRFHPCLAQHHLPQGGQAAGRGARPGAALRRLPPGPPPAAAADPPLRQTPRCLWQAIVTIGCGTRDIYEALEEGVGETEVLHELRELMEADPSPSPPERPPPSPPRPRTRGGGSAQRAQGRAAPAPPPPAAEVPPTVAVFNREEAAAVVFARAMRDLATGEPPEVPPLQLQWARVEKPRIGKKQQLPPPVHSAAAPAAEDSELRTEAAAQQVDGSIPSRRNPAVVLTAADGSAAGPGQGRRRHTHAAGPAVAAARAKNRSRSTTGSPPRQSVTPPQMAH
eukprot:TRINITY_DN13547_c0_g1_i1.p1 TRINITY_DN13547_c0_g1~~TRINITY_DN13547_c0_g1_i1.p1  ORF type:complete len:385 (+),score=51.49 TRINITY_DN13547_c0_g1_i1:56-1156(+)